METGRRFADRYLVLGEAGTGGMSTVHRAIDAATGATIALKIIRAVGADERARFEREAAILDQLVHPGIVRYVGHGVAADGACYLAMEWVTGTTLAQRLAEPGVALDETLSIARQLGETLAAVHAVGIVHRDVKPANIMLTGGDVGAARLIDFGVARPVAEERRLTRTGSVVGTPGYMAPEQARGARAIDARADLFALGCVLYECVTGRPAFAGDHVTAIRAKIVADEPLPPRAYDAELPADLEQLIRRLLAKDPAARPASAAAVVAALAGIAAPAAGPRRCRYTADAPTRRVATDDTIPERRVFVILAAVDDAAAVALGARLELLADGRAFAVASSPRHAGHLARELAAALPPTAPVVVAYAAGADAFGRAVDRAVLLLEDVEVATAMGVAVPAAEVHLDPEAAERLADDFEVEAAPNGIRLGRER